MRKPEQQLADEIKKKLARLYNAYRKQHAAYQAFIESIQGQQPRAKADGWMSYTSNEIDSFGDQEALVYLRSRGHECRKQIDKLLSNWKRAARQSIAECAKGISIGTLETGKTKRMGGMPLVKASDVKNLSPYILRNFWGGRDEQELSIDATMLRAVEWCDIGGFDDWWERLARSTTQDTVQGGIDPVPGSFWLFNMCRSDYAIELMDKALDRALEAIELALHEDVYPWRVLRPWGPRGDRDGSSVDHLPYACSIAFANWRLRPDHCKEDLVQQAAQTILKAQDEVGAWSCWADRKIPSVETTAMCVHALAVTRPRGWERAAAKAAEWLWAKQERSGCWLDEGSPDSVYLSVLVLDALDMVEGREQYTFAKRAQHWKASEQRGHRRFAVALSFPGEIRGVVEPVAENLRDKLGSERVLYDRFHEAELARPNLDVYLQKLYHEQSDFIVIFLCSNYAQKEWCGIEWRAVRDLIKTRRDGDVMLLRTDSGCVPGIFSIDGYVDIADRLPSDIANLIMARLEMETSQAPTSGSTRRRTRRA